MSTPAAPSDRRILFEVDGRRVCIDRSAFRGPGAALLDRVAPETRSARFYDRPVESRVVKLSAELLLVATGSPHLAAEFYGLIRIDPAITIDDERIRVVSYGEPSKPIAIVEWLDGAAYVLRSVQSVRRNALSSALAAVDDEIDRWIVRLGQQTELSPETYFTISRSSDGRPKRVSFATHLLPLSDDMRRAVGLSKRMASRASADGFSSAMAWLLSRPELSRLRGAAVARFNDAKDRHRAYLAPLGRRH